MSLLIALTQGQREGWDTPYIQRLLVVAGGSFVVFLGLELTRKEPLVDLRLFDPTDHSPKPRLVFRPEKLKELGIPEKLVEAAAKSDPQGFILFEDLPDQTSQVESCTNQLISEQSTK